MIKPTDGRLFVKPGKKEELVSSSGLHLGMGGGGTQMQWGIVMAVPERGMLLPNGEHHEIAFQVGDEILYLVQPWGRVQGPDGDIWEVIGEDIVVGRRVADEVVDV